MSTVPCHMPKPRTLPLLTLPLCTVECCWSWPRLIKYKCDHCSFEANSNRGKKTHRWHMHKDAEKLVEYSPEKLIYKCAFCESYCNNKYELLSMHIHIASRKTINLLIGFISSRMPTCKTNFTTEIQQNCSSKQWWTVQFPG